MKKILLIDDEELINRSLSKLLEMNGFKVIIARTGVNALNLAKQDTFDLIISDIRMPGLNGIDTVKGIFNHLDQNGQKKSPVIFITGYADERCEEEAGELKPVDYIYKPFDIKDLVERVKNTLN